MKQIHLTLKLIITVILTTIIYTNTFSQDGKLLKKRRFKPDPALIKELNNEYPGSNYADTFKLAEMSNITYMSDGNKIKGFIIIPEKPGNYPCLIYNRDGHEDADMLNEITVAQELHMISRWGYIVIASQYRGAAGGEGKDELGGEDINDVLNLIPLLGKIDKADTTRIGMYGRNRGGLMTYLALKKTNRIDAAVVSSGIANLFLFVAENVDYYDVLDRFVPNYPESKVVPIKERSMLYWPEELCKTAPILLLHGSADSYVHPTQSVTAFEKLFKEKQPTRLVIFEGGDNMLTEHKEESEEFFREWINKYVRDDESFPDINPN